VRGLAVLLAAALGGCTGGAGSAEPMLRVGAAAVEITPAVETFEDRNGDGRWNAEEPFTDLDGNGRWDPVWLAGFNSGRFALGVHDPLWARAVVFSQDGVSVAVVSCDLVGILHARLEEWVRPLVEGPEKLVDHVIVCSTHQHHGPDSMGLWGAFFGASGLDPAYLVRLRDAVRESVRKAWAARRPARVFAAEVDVPGVCKDSRPPDVRNEIASGILARGLDGGPLAVLSVFAMHPEAQGRRNRLVTSDYPGPLRDRLEKEFPGAVAVFAVADVGGMQTPKVAEESWPEVGRIGDTIAARLSAALAAAPELRVPAIRWTSKPVDFPMDNPRFAAAFKAGLFGRDLPAAALREEDGRRLYRSRVSALRLGDAVLVTAPGEALPEVGHEIRARVKARWRILLGLAHDEIGYILPKIDFDPKKYEESMSLGPLTAPTLLDALTPLLEGF
jgi:hypothetical protein